MLLQCMLTVNRGCETEEVKSAKFVAIKVDETTDFSLQTQLMLVVRCITVQLAVQSIFGVPSCCGCNIYLIASLLRRLNNLFSDGDKEKFISSI